MDYRLLKKSLKLQKCIFLPLLLPATGPVLPTYLKDGHPTQKFWLAPNWQIGGQQTKKGDYSQIWQGTSKSRPKKQFFFKNLSFSNNKTQILMSFKNKFMTLIHDFTKNKRYLTRHEQIQFFFKNSLFFNNKIGLS